MDLAGLADKRAYCIVLGSLIVNPSLLDDVDRPLSKEDFATEKFYSIVFVSVYNLYQQGVTKIDEFTIDSYLSNYKEQYQIFKDNNGLTWISDAVSFSDLSNYDYYYHRVRKYSLLRYYESIGLDTRILFDWSKVDSTEENVRFDNITEAEIVDYIEGHFVVEPKTTYCNSQLVQSIQAGEGLGQIVEDLLETPDYGFNMTSPAANTICRGLRRGKLYLRSAGTGIGKTRNFLMDACTLAIPYTYDLEQNKFVYTGHDTPTLFVGTEGSLQEFQTVILACVAGIDEKKIIMGQYDEGELERVKQAEEYISAAPLFLVYCDDFTISEVENLVKKYVLQKNVEVCIFDYIQTVPRLIGEINNKSSLKLQEYQILIQFAGRLKALAEKTQVAILTGAQLRPEAKTLKYQDETTLQGSKGMAQKVDIGCTISRVSPSDRKKIEAITSKMLGCPEINMLTWYWKVRQGSLVSIIVASHIDLGCLRIKDCFVMDYDFNLINIDFTKIEQVKETLKENSREIKSDYEEIDSSTDDEEETVNKNTDFNW